VNALLGLLIALGRIVIGAFAEVGRVTRFAATALVRALSPPLYPRRLAAQLIAVGYFSLPVIGMTALFTGAAIAQQIFVGGSRFNAASTVPAVTVIALVRELGPVMGGLIMAGRVASAMAAELGTMRVTEQIDAIQCLGTNPIQYLIVPRFVGIVISSLILLMIGLLISIAGAMFVASTLCGINFLQFAESIPRFTDGWTIAGGMFKSLVYGFIVAGVACHRGYTASGGARGVGKAVTMAAVYTNFYIVIANFVTSHIMDYLGELGRMWLGGSQ
jgi:phospholipid/cholesterol/gamma-HCH transport system permease protein